jgi:hypothetical protein
MKKSLLFVLICAVLVASADAKTLTYNELRTVNLNDRGLPADERSTNVLIAAGDSVFGATSGVRCHIFRFDPGRDVFQNLASIEGPNTILKGLALDGDTLYAGTMLTPRQVWWEARRRGILVEPEDVNLLPIDETWKTGRLYRITNVRGVHPLLEDLGVPVPGQGIQTLAVDGLRGRVYGLTAPAGRLFVYDVKTGRTETVTFGTTASFVSNHMVGSVEVVKDLTAFTPGEAEFNNKLIAKVLHVGRDGVLFTSGWDGQVLKYDPSIAEPDHRVSVIANIPAVPARHPWNRVDAVVEHDGFLILGTSDGYILRLDPATNVIENYGKPVRAVEVMGLAVSPLDGKIYGINGGDAEGVSRFWSLDPNRGIFEVNHPPVKMFNLKPMADIVSLDDGTLVMAETERCANLWVLEPGESKVYSTTVPEIPPPNPTADPHRNLDHPEYFAEHKKLEVEVFPIPSSMHGGSGYTAIQADDAGRIYIGGAYYGKFAPLMQLDPRTAQWRLIFRSDELTHEYGRGLGIPGKIHTKLRLGKDGRIYGAMKPGYEFDLTNYVGESPFGIRGGQYPSRFFAYDPVSDTTEDLGPAYKQDGVVGLCLDSERGFLYGMSEFAGYFLVYDLKTRRIWNAGSWAGISSNRYMAMDPVTGRVFHKGEVTPSGRHHMTVWDPETFQLHDYEIAAEAGLKYTHSYAVTAGAAGDHHIYGAADGQLVEMDTIPSEDGKLHVRPLCPISVDGETAPGFIYSIETGPDGRIYWACNYGDHGLIPMAFFAWDPQTRTKTYLGTASLGGRWIGGMTQGLCFDKDGNMGVHVLYAKLPPEMFRLTRRSADFEYRDIVPQPHFLGYPHHYPDTYYSVFYVKKATAIR